MGGLVGRQREREGGSGSGGAPERDTVERKEGRKSKAD